MTRETEDPPSQRFVANETCRQLSELEQAAWYGWAASHCRGRRVLDAGDRFDRSADLLLQAGASEVIAIQASDAAIELSRAGGVTGVTNEPGSPTQLPYEDDTFDLVVALGALDRGAPAEQILDEFARVLRPEGLLLASVRTSGDVRPGVPSDTAIPGARFQALLEARFESSRLLSQRVMLSNVIGPAADGELMQATVRMVGALPREDGHRLVAIAGDRLPPDTCSFVAAGALTPVREWTDEIARLERRLEDQASRLHDLAARQSDAAAAVARLADAEQELALARAREVDLDQAGRELTAARGELTAARDELAAARDELARLRPLEQSRIWRWNVRFRDLRARLRSL